MEVGTEDSALVECGEKKQFMTLLGCAMGCLGS